MSSESVKVTLTSSDGKSFIMDAEVAKMSGTLKNMLEDISDLTTPIPIPNVSGATMEKVVKYCEYHHTSPTDSSDERMTIDRPMCDFDKEFLSHITHSELFDLILAANYLDIKPLLDVTCKTVAGMIRGKSAEEIRKLFNIKNDFTPEEEEQVRKENEWCEDH